MSKIYTFFVEVEVSDFKIQHKNLGIFVTKQTSRTVRATFVTQIVYRLVFGLLFGSLISFLERASQKASFEMEIKLNKIPHLIRFI